MYIGDGTAYDTTDSHCGANETETTSSGRVVTYFNASEFPVESSALHCSRKRPVEIGQVVFCHYTGFLPSKEYCNFHCWRGVRAVLWLHEYARCLAHAAMVVMRERRGERVLNLAMCPLCDRVNRLARPPPILLFCFQVTHAHVSCVLSRC